MAVLVVPKAIKLGDSLRNPDFQVHLGNAKNRQCWACFPPPVVSLISQFRDLPRPFPRWPTSAKEAEYLWFPTTQTLVLTKHRRKPRQNELTVCSALSGHQPLLQASPLPLLDLFSFLFRSFWILLLLLFSFRDSNLTMVVEAGPKSTLWTSQVLGLQLYALPQFLKYPLHKYALGGQCEIMPVGKHCIKRTDNIYANLQVHTYLSFYYLITDGMFKCCALSLSPWVSCNPGCFQNQCSQG